MVTRKSHKETKTSVLIGTLKVISGFQALRQARAPVAGLEPTTEGSLQISGRTRKPLCYRRPPFGPLKRHLGDMAFETEDDLISELRNWFDNLDSDFFRVGINSLLSRWQKCIDLHGDHVEK
ncbi:histone-lysine N-methyltransferase SETMAR [Plakobranchus ocellatus]|uniref:Histone-lysine N-methyltransferase SETMAR n=1 Tax=Plakobranchus ocellatus TaxID=259542 RepID=A0AAV3YC81_9GAST|nr:histone-lysine N-methyltransferase SETMAR [Plakobranchus ocellatus]